MVNIAKLTKKRLGELLIAEGLIHNDQVQEALAEQQKNGLLLGEALIKLGYVTELDIAGALSTQFGLPYIDAPLPEPFQRRRAPVPACEYCINDVLDIRKCPGGRVGPLLHKL